MENEPGEQAKRGAFPMIQPTRAALRVDEERRPPGRSVRYARHGRQPFRSAAGASVSTGAGVGSGTFGAYSSGYVSSHVAGVGYAGFGGVAGDFCNDSTSSCKAVTNCAT